MPHATRKKRTTKTFGKLRSRMRHQRMARMLFLGWSTERIAKAVGCSVETIRVEVATPEYQGLSEQ